MGAIPVKQLVETKQFAKQPLHPKWLELEAPQALPEYSYLLGFIVLPLHFLAEVKRLLQKEDAFLVEHGFTLFEPVKVELDSVTLMAKVVVDDDK